MNKIDQLQLQQFETDGITSRTLDEYQQIATGSAFYPGQGSPLGLIYCALKLNGEAGELAEHVGKAMRDDGLIEHTETDSGDCISPETSWKSEKYEAGSLCEERHMLITKEVGDCLWYLSALCNELGISLATAAMLNLEKLNDRQKRGVQGGSGDDR